MLLVNKKKLNMNKSLKIVFFQILIFFGFALENSFAQEIKLWPEIEPYYTDYLKVSDIHELYYELSGNPKGKPVFVLHGGPGGGCSPYMRRYFNPEKYHIILHDQRGAGKSIPFAELKENTTQHLVEDIELLRKELNLDKIILFGGSWGATLGLAYAEKFPQNIEALVLRGVFTASKEEIDYFYHGGVKPNFPDIYDKFINSLPQPIEYPISNYLLSLILNGDSLTKNKYSRAWVEYETKISKLSIISDEDINNYFNKEDPLAFALIENYYMANGCFLKDNQF